MTNLAYQPTERDIAICTLSDMTKEAYGSRLYDKAWETMSSEEIQAEFDRLNRAVLESIKEDAAREDRALAVWKVRISDIIAAGARDRATAIRWDMQAMEADGQEVDYYCYLCGLSYEMAPCIEVYLRVCGAS